MNKDFKSRSGWEWLRNQQLFVACSGGIDSVVLVHFLRKISLDFTVLHVNYQLRGQDSLKDELFVRELCMQLQIPCLIKRFDTRKKMDETGGNLQEIARKVRYDWFDEICQKDSKNVILLAHHQTDQIETFFQHLARKSGVLGLACMLNHHQQIVRPFLQFSKEEIHKFAIVNQIAWREDVSNLKNEYTRNKLRNVFIPWVETVVPTLKDSVLEMITLFQAKQLELNAKISPLVVELKKHGKLLHSEYDSMDEFEKSELLRLLGLKQSLQDELKGLRNAIRGKKIYQNNFIIAQEKNYFELIPIQSTPQLAFVVEKVDHLPGKFSQQEIYIDCAKIIGDLKLRKWQAGDRIKPIGMNGSKLISKILAESTWNKVERENALVLVDEEKVIWCVHLQISREAIANPSSTQILKVKVQNRIS
jgi:tRNA(Ile)-lysidine synthase